MTSAPWIPPRFAGIARSGIWNALVSYAGHPVPLAKKGASAVFSLADPPAPESYAVVLEPANLPRCYVLWRSFPFKAMFNAELTAADLPDLPAVLRDALITGMSSLVWTASAPPNLGDLQTGIFGSLGALVDEPERTELAWFTVDLQGVAPEPISLVVGCDRAMLLNALSGYLLAPQKIHDALKAQLTATAIFTVGQLAVSLAQLRTIARGTVIVLPEDDPAVARVRVDDTMYVFRAKDAAWTCLSRHPANRARSASGHGDRHMGADDQKPPPDASGISGLPVVIDFDLGSRTVPLSELENWRAGSVVTLDIPARTAGVEVTLRVNGQAVGTGDLIRIDDRFAVRISHVLFGS